MSYPSTSPARRSVLLGLLWYDYRRHREGIVFGLSSIALVLFVVGIAEPYSTGMFLTMVTAMAFACGLGFGRAEWSEGHEEFSLSWPATRDQRFWVRLGLGSAVLGAIYLNGFLACYSPFPVWLAKLFSIDTSQLSQEGMTPFDPSFEFLVFAHVAPWLLFTETLALSLAIERQDEQAWMLRLGLVAAVAFGLQWGAQALLGAAAPWLVVPLLIAMGAQGLRRGLRAYRRKEAVLDLGATSPSKPRSMALLVIGLALVVLGTIAFWVFTAAYNN